MEDPNAVVTIYEVYTGKSTSEDNALSLDLHQYSKNTLACNLFIFLVIKSEWMFLAINNMKYQLSRILFHQYFMSLFWAVICVSDTVWFWNHALFFNYKATGWFCLGLLPIRDDNAKFNDIFFKTTAVEIESPDFWYKI